MVAARIEHLLAHQGERNLAKVTLPHAMMIAMPKNHFRRFNRGKAPIIRRLQSNRKAGIKRQGCRSSAL